MLSNLVTAFFGSNVGLNAETMLQLVFFFLILLFCFKLFRLFTRGL